ncbi:MAG TPA: extracellular solute-binding protein [Anaerolineae bacterium]|nr:extracellular solute-binding protein [Anaerolineae bacterium]
MSRKWFLITLIALLSLVLAACGGAPAATQKAAEAPKAAEEQASAPPPTEAPKAEVKDFLTWYQYDQNNEDPAADERVGNEYLRNTMPLFNKAFEGKWNWVNQPKAWDKMAAELVAAVQSGGEVPDLFETQSNQINSFYRNGTVQDLKEWAQAQPWFKDIDASAIASCTGPDGGLYCIPISQRPQIVYVWKDHFPDGFPATPEAFMKQAEALKAKGVYAITFWGSTDKGGAGINRMVNTTISSFGGKFDDGEGNMLLNTPENIAAIEFLREIVAKEYAPEVVFAGGYQEEEAFKDGSAGSFPSGLNGYRYLNPLTAPNGKKYDTGSAEDVLNALASGDMYLSQYLAAEGQKPGCNTVVAGFVIPVGAKNPEAAYDYINWIMEPEQNADWVLGPGGGFPALKATLSLEQFQSPFYQQASEALNASACRPWWGSLERPEEAQRRIMTTVYKLVKEDPTADIAELLTQTQDEYNANN